MVFYLTNSPKLLFSGMTCKQLIRYSFDDVPGTISLAHVLHVVNSCEFSNEAQELGVGDIFVQ